MAKVKNNPRSNTGNGIIKNYFIIVFEFLTPDAPAGISLTMAASRFKKYKFLGDTQN